MPYLSGSTIALPQGGPIALNRNHPVGAKLRHLFVPGIQLGAANGGVALGAAGDIQALQFGRTAKYTGTNVAQASVPGASAYPFVLVWAGRFLSTANTWRGLDITRSGGSGDAHYVYLNSSSQIGYTTRNSFSTQDFLTMTVPGSSTVGPDLVIVAQSLSATDHRLYCLGSNATSATNSGTPAGAFDTINLASNGNANHNTYLAAFGTTALTDAEALALSASVPEALRMLVGHQRRRVWVPVSSSGAAAFASNAAAVATATAALTTGISLQAAPAAVATATGALTTAITLQSAPQASASATAALSTAIQLQASPQAVATATAALTTSPAGLQASATAQATATAALTTSIVLQASAQAVATATAALTAPGAGMSATASAQATATAALTTGIAMQAAAAAQASASAALTTAILLQASASSSATATAALTASSSAWAASAIAQAQASASLTTAIRLAAIAQAQATATAALTAGPADPSLIEGIQSLLDPLAAGGAWYMDNTSEPPTYPYIVWQRIVSVANVSSDGPSDQQNTRIQIDIIGRLLSQVVAIETALEVAMIGAPFVNIPLSSQDGYEDAVRAYRISKDYSVWSSIASGITTLPATGLGSLVYDVPPS